MTRPRSLAVRWMRLGAAGVVWACAAAVACGESPLSVSSAAQVPAPATIRIDGSGIYPESITSSADGTLYIGSLGGTIYRAPPQQGIAEPWVERSAQNGLLSIFGVLADDRHRALWVCTSAAKLPGGVPSGTPAVLVFDFDSAKRTRFVPLPRSNSVCDDIALGPDGAAYIGDIGAGAIWRLAPHAAAPTLYAQDAALAGIDGIAFAADGRLYVDSISHNQIVRVERHVDGSFAGLTLLIPSAPLAGPDGLRPIGGNRFALAEGRAGRIDEITIVGNTVTVRVLATGLQSPAAVTYVRGTVYAPDGKIGYLFDPQLRGRDPGAFDVHAIPAAAGPRP